MFKNKFWTLIPTCTILFKGWHFPWFNCENLKPSYWEEILLSNKTNTNFNKITIWITANGVYAKTRHNTMGIQIMDLSGIYMVEKLFHCWILKNSNDIWIQIWKHPKCSKWYGAVKLWFNEVTPIWNFGCSLHGVRTKHQISFCKILFPSGNLPATNGG